MTYEAHPIANVFPEMSGEDFTRLVGDIDAHGLREPIWLFDGRILDGRHRYRACVELDLEPRFQTFEGSEGEAMLMSLSLNLARRHMTTEQRAALGVRIKEWEARAAGERRRATQNNHSAPDQEIFPGQASGQARDIAGEKVGVSGRSVDDAEKIRDAAPDVFDRMSQGAYGSMATAKKVAALDEQQRERVHEDMDAGATAKQALKVRMEEPKEIEFEADAYSTPPWLLDLVREVCGAIEFDPASNDAAQEYVQAITYYTADDNGLDPARWWSGVTWLNPPYSQPACAKFIARAVEEWRAGNLEELWVLTNAAVNTQWWHELTSVADVVMFPPKRIQFWHPQASAPDRNRYEQSLVYCGAERARAVEVFEGAGWRVFVDADELERTAQPAPALPAPSPSRGWARDMMGMVSMSARASKRRYHELTALAHPDRNGGSNELQQIINALWEVAK